MLPPRGSSKLEEACDMYVRAANMFKMAKNWCGKMIISNQVQCIYCPSFMLRLSVLHRVAFSLQLQEMHFPKPLAFTCRCRANTMRRLISLMLETPSKKQIHKVGIAPPLWLFNCMVTDCFQLHWPVGYVHYCVNVQYNANILSRCFEVIVNLQNDVLIMQTFKVIVK